MANKKTSILNTLVTELLTVSSVATATRILLQPAEARKKAPYAGLISGTEEAVVEDATDVRFELNIDIILLIKGRDIEKLLDEVKDLLYGASIASTIGALQLRIIGQEEVALIDADSFSSTRIVAVVTYVATKGDF